MLVRKLLLAVAVVSVFVDVVAQPTLSYLIPDIGAPGMAVYIEFVAPTNSDLNGTHFGVSDGVYLNNPGDPLRIELVRPEDSSKIVFGPLIASWSGRLITTLAFVLPTATPNSWDWRQLSQEWRIPLRVRTPNGVTTADTFYIVRPTPGADVWTRAETVLGRSPLGVRSRRGALLFDSLILGGRTYTISTDDPDQDGSNGNQGYLPLVLLSTGTIRGVSPTQTRISFDANGIDGGPGGGGGGGEFCDISGGGSSGGSGYTSGGRGGTNTPNSYRGLGSSSGPNGSSLNGCMPGTDGGTYESSGGGTGHPFGSSGSGCGSGSDCSPDGGYGGASGVSDNRDGAAGGYATPGVATSINGNNAGRVHGDTTLVPLAGGAGGASGNPRNSSFPFVACGGRGGGGGGAVALCGMEITSLSVTANGGDGSGSGTSSSRRGGGGSGGGIHLAALGIRQVQLSAIGGNQSNTKGGDGRIRFDAADTLSVLLRPSAYIGPTMDTIAIASRDFLLKGSGTPGKTIVIFVKPSNGIWRAFDTVIVGSNCRWSTTITLPRGTDYLLCAAAQREQPQTVSRTQARPTAVFSHASGRIVRVLAPPLEIQPAVLDMGRISCVNGNMRTDSVRIINPGTRGITISTAFLGIATTGFRILRPRQFPIPTTAGDTLSIVVEFHIQPGHYGLLNDTIIVRGGTPDTVIARIPVRITVDSAGVIVTDTVAARSIDFVDFAETCRGTTKQRTFALRAVGTSPVVIRRLGVGTSIFTVSQLSRTTLAPGDTVRLHLRATPATVGTFYDTLTVEVDVCDQVVKIPLRVHAIESSIIGVGATGDIVDFGNVRVGGNRSVRLGIVNRGTTDSVILLPSRVLTPPYSWQPIPPNRPFPTTIRSGDTLWLTVTFSPTAMGLQIDTLVFISQQSGLSCPDTVRFIMVGVGTVSNVVPNKALLDFGTIACGSRRDTIWLRNIGNSDAQLLFPATIGGTDAGYFTIIEQPPAQRMLATGDSIRIIIEARVYPQNPDGIKTAMLTLLVREDTIRTLEIPLRMLQQALVLEFTPQPYVLVDVPVNFSSQSQPPLTVRNLSSVEACISAIRTRRPEIVPLVQVITVPPYSASRDLYFTITPTSLSPIEDTITIVLSCPCVDSVKIPIRIMPTNNALAISPRPLDFGIAAPCTTVRRTLTIKNNDPSSSATIEELNISGRDSRLFRITGTPWATLPYSIPSGFSFSVEIEFNPAGTRTGVKNAHFALRYIINGQEVLDTVNFIGERTIPIEADSVLDFGEVKQGDTRTLPLQLTNNYTRSMTYTFGVSQWMQYYSVTPQVVSIDVVTKTATADVEYNAGDTGQFDDTLWVRFTSLGMNCTDSIPVLLRAVSIPGIGFSIWLDSLRILNPRDRQVALNIYGQLDTALMIPNAQLLLVLDVPNQLFMPTGVRARGGRIQSFNSRTHDRHNITITIDTLLAPISSNPQVITQLVGDAMLGDRQCDSVFIVQARWTNTGIKPTTWLNPGTGNGQLCLTLCGAGGLRLLGSTLQLPLLTITPNPATDVVHLTVAPNEQGEYAIELLAADGRIIDRVQIGKLSAGYAYQVSVDMSHYATGTYWCRIYTPSATRHYPMLLIR
ncbi:MAG: choice-of-anchor D domain-containing protein [Chlorobi bacterium]|nr:choice-of-anchor D domain-containing protein [Chlorobiota bacterium]